jgi:hypothetical protein
MATGDLDQTGLALAALTACIVRTLHELDPGVRPAFERYLDNAYGDLRHNPKAAGALETLAWTREFVKNL